ncbi:hypothetical protein BC332_33812 [Capsicum chinense]|nr:hypothetical protein BC332_33812 [Capsicum chinense]
MSHSESRKSSICDAVVFRERPLDIGKTNLSHDGLNHAHVPYWWVNNPTLGEFCFTIIGRADIKGSKSNVAMNAWLSQDSYPCGNFSDTSIFKFRSRIPLVRTSSELAVRRAGKAPEGTVPSPSPGRHAATRSRRGSSSSSPPTADGFGTGTPVPSPQSQSFSQTYGSILPTFLCDIVPSTRGCSPWRPDAVMSTTGCGRHLVLQIFKGLWERTGHHATCGALPAAGPYLRLSQFQVSLRASTRVSSGFAPLRHSSPSFGSRQVCSHSNPSQKIKVGRRCTPRGDPTNQLPCALRVYSPVDTHTCQTPWSMFQDGSNGELTSQSPERADAEARQRHALPAIIEETEFHERTESPLPPNPCWSTPRVDRRTGSSPFHIRPGRIPGPHPLPSRQFQALFDSLFKVLFIFPSRYLFAIGLSPVFSLGWNSPPDLGCIPKQPDS